MTIMMQPRGHMWLEAPAYRVPAAPQAPGRASAIVPVLSGARVVREAALVIFAYFLVRGFTEGDKSAAVSHAPKTVSIEKAGGFFWEPAIQEKIVQYHAIVTAANWM